MVMELRIAIELETFGKEALNALSIAKRRLHLLGTDLVYDIYYVSS